MNSLRSNSISHFVTQIAHRNQRLNNDSKDLHSSKDLLVRNVFEELRDEKAWSTKCGNRRQSLGSSKRSSFARLLPKGRKNVFEELRDDKRLA